MPSTHHSRPQCWVSYIAAQVVRVWRHLFVPQPELLLKLTCERCRQDQTPTQEMLVDARDDEFYWVTHYLWFVAKAVLVNLDYFRMNWETGPAPPKRKSSWFESLPTYLPQPLVHINDHTPRDFTLLCCICYQILS